MEQNKLNKDEVFLLDTFQLDYYGTPIIFQVCKTDVDKVAIYELATKEIKQNNEKVCVITEQIRASDKAYVVPREQNAYTKSNYWVKTTTIDGFPFLELDIGYDSALVIKAILNGVNYPITGKIYANKIKDIKKYFWKLKERTIEA